MGKGHLAFYFQQHTMERRDAYIQAAITGLCPLVIRRVSENGDVAEAATLIGQTAVLVADTAIKIADQNEVLPTNSPSE